MLMSIKVIAYGGMNLATALVQVVESVTVRPKDVIDVKENLSRKHEPDTDFLRIRHLAKASNDFVLSGTTI